MGFKRRPSLSSLRQALQCFSWTYSKACRRILYVNQSRGSPDASMTASSVTSLPGHSSRGGMARPNLRLAFDMASGLYRRDCLAGPG